MTRPTREPPRRPNLNAGIPILLLALAMGCNRSSPSPPDVVTALTPGPGPQETASQPVATEPVAALADTTARGPAEAPVTIVEFSDFQCPFSQKASSTIREIVTRHSGLVRWVFKSFPLPFHRQAPLLHEAALAAGEWGLFWEMHDAIFAATSALDRRQLVEAAVLLGIPRADFESVLDSRAFSHTVEAEAAEGASLGVTATPTFFVNGFRIEGAVPLEVFDYLVQRSVGRDIPPPENMPLELLLGDPEPSHPFAFGPTNAALVARVFLDLRSPLGLKAAPIASDLVKHLAGKARLVFKYVPTGIYADSQAAHEAAVALVQRGADFFEVWRRCARTRGIFHAGSAAAMAEELGLGPEKAMEVERELREGTHRRVVEADRILARRLGVKGSPTLLAQGARFDGIEGLAEFALAMDSGQEPPRAKPLTAGRSEAGESVANTAACGPDGLSSDSRGLLLGGAETGEAFDFGEVASGAAVIHVFEARNHGTQLLRITSSVLPSVLEIREIPPEIAPGAVQPLETLLLTGWSRGKVDVGFRLFTNDSTRPALAFRLRGIVSEDVGVVPAGGFSMRAVAGDAAEAAVELRFGGTAPREVAFLGSSVAGLEARIEPLEPGRRFRVRARLAPGAPVGERRGTLRLKTSHERVPEVLLPVDVLVRPELLVTPSPVLARDAAKPLWIRLESGRGVPFTIQEARVDLPFVSLVPVPGPPASGQRLAVRINGSKLPGASARGEILILLEPAPGATWTQRELRVPFLWDPGER